MNSLAIAVDDLTAATSVIMTAVEVASVASEADTKPEQVELQNMLETDAYSIDTVEVAEYNDAVQAVEKLCPTSRCFHGGC